MPGRDGPHGHHGDSILARVTGGALYIPDVAEGGYMTACEPRPLAWPATIGFPRTISDEALPAVKPSMIQDPDPSMSSMIVDSRCCE